MSCVDALQTTTTTTTGAEGGETNQARSASPDANIPEPSTPDVPLLPGMRWMTRGRGNRSTTSTDRRHASYCSLGTPPAIRELRRYRRHGIASREELRTSRGISSGARTRRCLSYAAPQGHGTRQNENGPIGERRRWPPRWTEPKRGRVWQFRERYHRHQEPNLSKQQALERMGTGKASRRTAMTCEG